MIFICVGAFGAMAQPAATPAPSPPATTAGNVSRVTYYDILQGKGNDLTTFLRTHAIPILEEQKKQGLIVSYSFFNKAGTDGPGDWDLGQIVTYKNYAEALDSNAERGEKFNAIGLAHYGSADARTKANDSLSSLRTTTSSILVRALTYNPMPK